jgi:succinate dehydrogenase / fumarate reductase membrane anchor subunit
VTSGTGHFIAQRVSAIVLVVLGLWFTGSINGLTSMEHVVVAAFIAEPLNAALLAVLGVTLAFHSYLGVEVIIDDYVHSTGMHKLSMLASRIAHILVALASVYAVWTIGFGA